MSKGKTSNILELFLIFLKIGFFTFGGGYAMLSIIHTEVVDKKKWISDNEMLDMVAIAESTPGVIAVNMATFVGYKIGGFLGSALATLGVILMPFIIILLITLFFVPYMTNEWIEYAFAGIRCGVIVLIINAAIKLNKVNKRCFFNIFLTCVSFLVATFISQISVIYILIFGLICGIVYNTFINKAFLEEGEKK